MALISLFFIIAFLIVLGLFAAMVVTFIVGMVLKNKNKTVSRVMFTFSGIMFALFVIAVIYIFVPKNVEIETPDGTQMLKSNIIDKYENAVWDCDFETVDSMLDEYPALVYMLADHTSDALQYYANENNIDGVKCLLAHGAYFDNGVTLRQRGTEYSLEDYFVHLERESDHDTTVEVVKLMIENGAQVNYDDTVHSIKVGAVFDAIDWACADDEIDDKELETITLIVESGADLYRENYSGHTPVEAFDDTYEGIPDSNVEKLRAILGG